MNIFVLDRDPQRAARYHCDRHVVKMPLETAQLLSTALWCLTPGRAPMWQKQGSIYRPTHRRHPCVLWTVHCLANFRWLTRLGVALLAEYSYRYGKRHGSGGVIGFAAEFAQAPLLPVRSWAPARRVTPFAQAMPEQYRRDDAVAAYRAYYLGEKASFASWTRRRTPCWYATGLRTRAGEHRAVDYV